MRTQQSPRTASASTSSNGRREARLELICVGTELLSGRVNTHQSYLSKRLLDRGLSLSREASMPDDLPALTEAIQRALERADALILCGGLGPTFDDITREAVSAAVGRRMIYHPELYDRIKKKFARYKQPVPEENKRQAFVLEGARALENEFGSAPGQLLRLGEKTVAMLPGPFSELAPIFERDVLPELARAYGGGRQWVAASFHISGLPESVVDERLCPAMKAAGPDAQFTILAGSGQVDFFARVCAATRPQAGARLAVIVRKIEKALKGHVFARDGGTLEDTVGRLLLARGKTLAVAESCTGGLVGERLTGVPGSSRYFAGGVIAYANELKTGLLGCSPKTLQRWGAVSSHCAAEMAEGARANCGADYGLSVTGIAGPGGGTKDKPVGLVYLALAGVPGGPRVQRLKLSGDRSTIRQRAASAALHLLWRELSAA